MIMADSKPPDATPLAATLAGNMNESLLWMSRLWGGAPAAAGPDAQRASGAMPALLPSMMMPTLDPIELDKRIGDLRTVAHWLEMNRTVLLTTIQTLEMQRNALASMQAMARAVQSGGAPAAASAASPAIASNAASAPVGSEAPPFDPTLWWGTLQEQFAQVALAAIAEARPRATEPPPEQAQDPGADPPANP